MGNSEQRESKKLTQIVVQIKALYSINSFEDKLKTFPRTSTLKLNKSNLKEVMDTIETPPLFTPVWLVIVSTKLTEKQLKTLVSKDNIFVLINCNSKKSYEDLREQLISCGVKYSLVDNSTATKLELIAYCKRELGIDDETAKYLCKRQNYILNKVVNCVLTLSVFDIVDKKVIKEYTTRMQSTSLLDLVDYILGVAKRKKYKALVSLVYDYRYGFNYLLEFTKGELKNRLEVYDLIGSGELTLDNYKTYLMENKLKYNSYFVFRVLEDYKHISYDKLYLLYNAVCKIPQDRSSIYKYLRLLEMGGNLDG